MHNLLLLLATCSTAVLAAPANNAFCGVVNVLVTNAKAQKPATAYCSSFLSIATKMTTITPAAVSPSTVSVTVTISTEILTKPLVLPTYTLLAPSTVTAPDDVTTEYVVETVTIPATTFGADFPCLTSTALQKRVTTAAKSTPVAKPACFATFSAKPLISSACSCLSIPTPVATVTASPIAVSPVTQTFNVIATTTITQGAIDVTITYTPAPVTELRTVTISSTTSTITITAEPTFAIQSPSNSRLKFGSPAPGNQANFVSTPELPGFTLESDCVLRFTLRSIFRNKYPASSDEGSRVKFLNIPNTGGDQRIYCKVVAGSNELLCGYSAATVQRTEHELSGGVDYWIVDPSTPPASGLVLTAVIE